MYTVAVCDDEQNITRRIRDYIEEWNPQVQVECFGSGEELLENYHPFDAIFLDIDMGGMNGIDTGRKVREADKETKIIYLTAYRDYVAGAFEVHAFQYLLKPVRQEQLHHALEEVFRYARVQEKKLVLDFRTVEGVVCLPADSICYFEYLNRRIRIVTVREEYWMVDRIGLVLERVQDLGFSMPHQSFVVNMLHVKNIKGLEIVLDNGMILPLSQKKQKSWKQELTAYLSKQLEKQRGG